MILGIFKISGHSMMPALKPNDRIIVSSLPYFFSKPKAFDIIAFKYNGKVLVKRIAKDLENSYFVQGDNKEDSLKIKQISKKEILGKVIIKI